MLDIGAVTAPHLNTYDFNFLKEENNIYSVLDHLEPFIIYFLIDHVGES